MESFPTYITHINAKMVDWYYIPGSWMSSSKDWMTRPKGEFVPQLLTAPLTHAVLKIAPNIEVQEF